MLAAVIKLSILLTVLRPAGIDSADADVVSKIIRAIADRTNFIHTGHVDFWIRQILAGNERAVNAMILASLPYVQNFEILRPSQQSGMMTGKKKTSLCFVS